MKNTLVVLQFQNKRSNFKNTTKNFAYPMLTVKALRSQVELWKEYFHDAEAEIENIETLLVQQAGAPAGAKGSGLLEEFQLQLKQQKDFITETNMALQLAADKLLSQNPDQNVDEDYMKEAKVLGNDMDAFQKSFNTLKDQLKEVMKRK